MIVSASAFSASSSTCTPSETEGNNGFEIRIALSLRHPRDQRFTRRSAPNLRKNPVPTPFDIKAGTVWLNCHHVFDPVLPFGGYKQSGWGRENGAQALENYLETKAVTMVL